MSKMQICRHHNVLWCANSGTEMISMKICRKIIVLMILANKTTYKAQITEAKWTKRWPTDKQIKGSLVSRLLCLTYGSKTMRVMYSLGMRGSWCEKTFWRPTSHRSIWSVGSLSSVLLMTWNSIMPRFSSRRAASSREVWAVNRLVYSTSINMSCAMNRTGNRGREV